MSTSQRRQVSETKRPPFSSFLATLFLLVIVSASLACKDIGTAPAAAANTSLPTGGADATPNTGNSPTDPTLSSTSTASQSTPQPANASVPPTASSEPIPPPQAAGYTLSFADDFNTLNLSSSGNPSAAYPWYPLSVTNGVSVSNSILTLDLSLPNNCASAIGTSQAWQYGYFEIRMKWPNATTGAWPALWMLPVGQTTGSTAGENGGEIDIMEGQGGVSPNTIFGTVHEWVDGIDVWNNEGTNAYTAAQGVDFSQYHVYGVLWTPGVVSWYFDNQLILSSSFPSTIDAERYYLILAMQAGVSWTYADLTGVQPSDMQMQVDWVHVWQQP